MLGVGLWPYRVVDRRPAPGFYGVLTSLIASVALSSCRVPRTAVVRPGDAALSAACPTGWPACAGRCPDRGDLPAGNPAGLRHLLGARHRRQRARAVFCILWVLKLGLHAPAMRTLARVISNERATLTSVIVIFVIVLIVAATAAHMLERERQPEIFGTAGGAVVGGRDAHHDGLWRCRAPDRRRQMVGSWSW